MKSQSPLFGSCHPSQSALRRGRDNLSIVRPVSLHLLFPPPILLYGAAEDALLYYDVLTPHLVLVAACGWSFSNGMIGTDCCVVCQVTTTSLIPGHYRKNEPDTHVYEISWLFLNINRRWWRAISHHRQSSAARQHESFSRQKAMKWTLNFLSRPSNLPTDFL